MTRLKQGATLHGNWGFGWRTIAGWDKKNGKLWQTIALWDKKSDFSCHFAPPTFLTPPLHIVKQSCNYPIIEPNCFPLSHIDLWLILQKKLRGQKDFLRVVKMKCSVSNNWGASSKLKWTQSNWAACAHSVSAHLQLPFGDPGLMRPPSGDLGIIICLPDRL